MKQLEELNELRRSDIRVLVKSRNARKYMWSWLEIRNYLFVYAVCCSDLKYTKAIRELNDLKNQLPHYSDNYYNSLCKNLKSYCNYYLLVDKTKYQFSNAKLIDMLKISNYEERNLDSIISDKERDYRENILIDEELERFRIENEIEDSIRSYEEEQEIRHAMGHAKCEDILFHYRDPFFDDSDM